MSFVAGAMESHGVLGPCTPGDWKRTQLRLLRPPPLKGRPVTDLASYTETDSPKAFWSGVGVWVSNMGALLLDAAENVEKINEIVLLYGRCNSVSSFKPISRQQLQAAWDMAFSWAREEKLVRDLAMPWQVLLSKRDQMTAVISCYRKTRSSRIGTRFLRFVNQRHGLSPRDQSAELDIPDLLSLVELAFQDLVGHQRLWPFSDQTLRRRFADILKVCIWTARPFNVPKHWTLGREVRRG